MSAATLYLMTSGSSQCTCLWWPLHWTS